MDRKPFFAFYAYGPEFDVDEYVATSTIVFDVVYHVGEPCSAMNPKPNIYSGVTKYLGEPNLLDIFQQDKIAQVFLRDNFAALKKLADRADVTKKNLGLSPELNVQKNTIISWLGCSQELVQLAGSLGISLSMNVATKIVDP